MVAKSMNNFPKHSFRVEHAESLKRFHLDVDVAHKICRSLQQKMVEPTLNPTSLPLKIDGWKMIHFLWDLDGLFSGWPLVGNEGPSTFTLVYWG